MSTFAINRLMTIWKYDFSDRIKQEFFKAQAISELLYDCTTRTLTKHLKRKLNSNYTRMLLQKNPESSTLQNSICMTTYFLPYRGEFLWCSG